jgi:hypothetical protein
LRLGMRISQLLGPGTMPSHQLYKRPISRIKIFELHENVSYVIRAIMSQ